MTCMCGDAECLSCGLAQGTVDYEPVPLTLGKTVKTRYVYTGPIPARELPDGDTAEDDDRG